jgi:hypothetical protein
MEHRSSINKFFRRRKSQNNPVPRGRRRYRTLTGMFFDPDADADKAEMTIFNFYGTINFSSKGALLFQGPRIQETPWNLMLFKTMDLTH